MRGLSAATTTTAPRWIGRPLPWLLTGLLWRLTLLCLRWTRLWLRPRLLRLPISAVVLSLSVVIPTFATVLRVRLRASIAREPLTTTLALVDDHLHFSVRQLLPRRFLRTLRRPPLRSAAMRTSSLTT